MSREFKEVIEVTTVTDEYYRQVHFGAIACLRQIHHVWENPIRKGNYTTRYVLEVKSQDNLVVSSVEFLGGSWEKISYEEYVANLGYSSL